MRTFRNGKKSKEGNRPLVSSTRGVVHVPNREIQQVKVILPGSDGDSHLVAAKDDGHEGKPLGPINDALEVVMCVLRLAPVRLADSCCTNN